MGRLSSLHCGIRTVSHMSLVFGLAASGALSLAIATDYWLYTTELLEFELPSQTNNEFANETDSDIVIQAQTIANIHSGLWRFCILLEDLDGTRNCYTIVYFGQDYERPDHADTTNSILRAIRKSSPVILTSLLLMLTSTTLSMLGNNKRDIRTLVAAILYICSALSLAIGIIFYISAVNDEVSHRKKSITSESDGFRYDYGWAFFAAGFAFMCSMGATVNNISLYLHRLPDDKLDALVKQQVGSLGRTDMNTPV